MECSFRPTNTEVLHVFTETVEGAGGDVTSVDCDRNRLYLRATLPDLAEVQPGDPVRRGVALYGFREGVHVSPYVFRVVCSNGSIMSETARGYRIDRVDRYSPAAETMEWTLKLRDAIQACLEPEVFTEAVEKMRVAGGSLLQRLGVAVRQALAYHLEVMGPAIEEAQRRFDEGDDDSLYGMVNAITSTARDEEDPELRWRLEELGGGVLALVDPPFIKTDSAAAELSVT